MTAIQSCIMFQASPQQDTQNVKVESDSVFILQADCVKTDRRVRVKQEADIPIHCRDRIKDKPSKANAALTLIKKEELEDLTPVSKVIPKCEDSPPAGLIPPVDTDEECDITLRKNSRKSRDKSLNVEEKSGKGNSHHCARTLPRAQIYSRKTFRCETCGKTFKKSALLTDHVKVHRRKRPYLCDQCGMNFAKPAYLKIHLRRHAGEKSFRCDQCDKSFFDKYDLSVHLRDHTGERPYVCPECGKSFKRIYILNKHKRTHSKEKPFPCEVCGKAYRYIYSYRTHLKLHST